VNIIISNAIIVNTTCMMLQESTMDEPILGWYH
jgi:hypothetical protein